MIIVAGLLDFADKGDRDRVIAAAADLQQATLDEPGCHAYCFAPDPGVDVRVQVYELWEDEASLAAHFKHPNYIEMRSALRSGSRVATQVEKFRCDLREPVYDDTHTPRADFFTPDT